MVLPRHLKNIQGHTIVGNVNVYGVVRLFILGYRKLTQDKVHASRVELQHLLRVECCPILTQEKE
jgi:hypothetical protein